MDWKAKFIRHVNTNYRDLSSMMYVVKTWIPEANKQADKMYEENKNEWIIEHFDLCQANEILEDTKIIKNLNINEILLLPMEACILFDISSKIFQMKKYSYNTESIIASAIIEMLDKDRFKISFDNDSDINDVFVEFVDIDTFDEIMKYFVLETKELHFIATEEEKISLIQK